MLLRPQYINKTLCVYTLARYFSAHAKHTIVLVQAKIFASPRCHCFLLSYRQLKDPESVPSVPRCPQIQQDNMYSALINDALVDSNSLQCNMKCCMVSSTSLHNGHILETWNGLNFALTLWSIYDPHVSFTWVYAFNILFELCLHCAQIQVHIMLIFRKFNVDFVSAS